MFWHYPVTLRELAISTLLCYTSILYPDQQIHNYLTDYHTATFFDTMLLPSESLQSVPCYVTPVFCTLTNKYTIISQIITPLLFLTLSCYPQRACNQYLAMLHQYFVLWPTNTQLSHKLSHRYMFRYYAVTLRELAISTLLCYTSILYSDKQIHNYLTNYHTTTFFDTILLPSESLQ
jgi:hypothetical protein